MEKYEIVKFEDCELSIDVKVSPNENTVWLTQKEIAILFKKSRSTITEHINNIFTEGELEQMTSVGISDRSNHRPAKLYNLDVVLAVGFGNILFCSSNKNWIFCIQSLSIINNRCW